MKGQQPAVDKNLPGIQARWVDFLGNYRVKKTNGLWTAPQGYGGICDTYFFKLTHTKLVSFL